MLRELDTTVAQWRRESAARLIDPIEDSLHRLIWAAALGSLLIAFLAL